MWLLPGRAYKIVAYDAQGNLLWSKDNVLTQSYTSINQTSTGQFYENLGANIDRLNDRVFIGAATINDGQAWNGTTHGDQDYVSQNIPQGPSTAVAQIASLSTVGGIGGLFGTRSSDSGGSQAQGTLGMTAVGINDYTTIPVITEAGYFEAQRKPAAGITTGVEIDIVNQGTVVDYNPYTSLFGAESGQTIGMSIASGGARAGPNTASAALNFMANGAAFTRGIVFTYGSSLTGECVSMPNNYYMKWYNGAYQTLGTALSSTLGSAIVTFTASSYVPYVGMPVVMSNGFTTFPVNTYVHSVNSATQVTMSANALTTSSGLSFSGLIGSPSNYIQSQCTSSHQDSIIFTDAGILMGASPNTNGGIGSAGGLLIAPVNSAAHYVVISPSVAGLPSISTNSNNLLLSSATGTVSIGNIAASPTAVVTNSGIAINATIAPAAGGDSGSGITFGTDGLRVLHGSGTPTVAAIKGSLYLRTDGSTTTDRMYVATNNAGGWTAVTTVA